MSLTTLEKRIHSLLAVIERRRMFKRLPYVVYSPDTGAILPAYLEIEQRAAEHGITVKEYGFNPEEESEDQAA